VCQVETCCTCGCLVVGVSRGSFVLHFGVVLRDSVENCTCTMVPADAVSLACLQWMCNGCVEMVCNVRPRECTRRPQECKINSKTTLVLTYDP